MARRFGRRLALLGPGRPGSTKLRKALTRHQPRLALTESPHEVTLFTLRERFDLPLPEVAAWIAGWKLDFYWPDYGLVVEVDPYGNHHTPAQVDRDRRKDLALRAKNLIVNRYSRDQLSVWTIGPVIGAHGGPRVLGLSWQNPA